MYMTGGDMNSLPSNDWEDTKLAAAMATGNGVITGVLFQIPNQHCIFKDDPIQKSRSEDALIAYTWDHYLKDTSKPEWLVRFPMVKAGVRAMDAMTEFVAKVHPELNAQLDYYTVSGASKRGWTTWLVGAVDPTRVVLIVPIVLDAINFVEFSHHQWKSYNGWSFALSDYTDMDIMSRLDTPEMLMLQQMEDPYFYIERLTMPKLIVNAVMDEFQQPDDEQFWWSDMPSPKHFMMVPNAEHSMATGILEAVPDITSWLRYHLLGEGAKVPTFDWVIDNNTGAITATLNEHGVVDHAKVWYAYSCGTNTDTNSIRRDFRVAMLDDPCTCGIAAQGYCSNLKSIWHSTELEQTMVKGKRTYTAHMDGAEDGRYVAYMIEITYRNEHKVIVDGVNPNLRSKETIKSVTGPIKDFFGKLVDAIPHDLMQKPMYTTQVSIWPSSYPYPDCNGGAANSTLEQCQNILR